MKMSFKAILCHTSACSKQIMCYNKWDNDSSCSDVSLPKDNCLNLEEAQMQNCVRRMWKGLQRVCRWLLVSLSQACSSRSTPKPRPPTTTMRPNITFQTYACPETYAKWYCLNGATCFSVKIGESILYNCECADGYMGQRCEFKDLDGSYAIKERGVIIERASIAGGLTIVVLFLVVSLCVCLYLRQRKKDVKESYDSSVDSERKPFSSPVSDRRKPPQDSVPSDVESGESGPSNVRSSELSTSP
ncbi:protein spitz-like isoform X3 [Tachypleus tridentatus]|uniref:protein spitz-like isoform X3 n=1 Tax=Tachypleus tridentatus TaxID=6853 RepID=UPI003FD2EE0C